MCLRMPMDKIGPQAKVGFMVRGVRPLITAL